MKDSGIPWLETIPNEWNICRLKDVGSLYGGLTGKSGDDFNVQESDNFSWFIPFTNIFNNSIIDKHKLQKVKIKEDESQNYVGNGDLLFLMSSEDIDGIGKSALLNEEIPNLCLNSFCKGFKTNKNKVNSIFLNYLMSSHILRESIRMEAKGFIRINLRQDKLSSITILLPPLVEQKAIADFLDRKCREIDELISLQERMIDELKAYKQSVITEAVTKGLNPNAPLKDSGIEWIGEIPQHWKVLRIGIILQAKAGGDAKPDLYSEYKDLQHPYPVYTNSNSAEQVYAYTSLPVFTEDAITVTGRGDIGKTFYRKGGFDAIIRLLVMTPLTKLNLKYYMYFIGTVIPFLSDSAAVGQLSSKQISLYKTVFPPLSEQQEIADFLDKKCSEIDSLIELKQQKIEELKEYRKSIIYEYVTGKKEVEINEI